MSAFGVAIPLQRDSSDGFRMIKSIKSLIRQNLKMLILTDPGERVMQPNFGVGIRTYLFKNFNEGTLAEIDVKIRQQIRIYMPAINIVQISFGQTDPDNNYLGIMLVYSIPGISVRDSLEITI
jgi:phage baseplate assembly protein W